MWESVDVEMLRELDPAAIGPFENVDAKDGIFLNHDYVDLWGYSIADAQEIVAEEAQLLNDIKAIGDDDDRLEELLEALYQDASELSGFDVGTAGAIFALSAAGAAPISSCNGGLLGETSPSQVPHILFPVARDGLRPILAAAEAADVGVLNNAGHVEIFANRIPGLHTFAKQLLHQLEQRGMTALNAPAVTSVRLTGLLLVEERLCGPSRDP